MGKFRSLAAILSLYFLLLASVASSRVPISDSKDSPSSTPTPVSSRSPEIPPPNPSSPLGVQEGNETCDSLHVSCRGSLTVCLRHSEKDNIDSKKYSVVVKKIGDGIFNVNITGKPAFPITNDSISLPKDIPEKIDLRFDALNVTEIFIDSGSGNCSIQIRAPDSDWNFLLPTYDIRLTPIYGLYLLGLTVVVSGATWACCRYRKRRNTDSSGIPYQQIEMSDQPQSTVTIDSNAVDGWDDWDDNWDDEAATRPAEKHTSTSVSSNSLTPRTPKKDGWDSAWDD